MIAPLAVPDPGQAPPCPPLDWRDGVPVSRRFGKGYQGSSDALAERRHVFLLGNGLPTNVRSGFAIAELGSGSGLHAPAAARAWTRAGLPGAAPLRPTEIARALAPWPELAALANGLIAAWSRGLRRIAPPGQALGVIEGDARATIPAWTGRGDARFLDRFSPARNPERWELALPAAVACRTAPGAWSPLLPPRPPSPAPSPPPASPSGASSATGPGAT